MEVNCETLAVIGATLANGGVCPITRYNRVHKKVQQGTQEGTCVT